MLEDIFNVVKSRFDQEPKNQGNGKVTIPSDLLFKCPRCQNVMFMEDFIGSVRVCAQCGYHARLTVSQRLE